MTIVTFYQAFKNSESDICLETKKVYLISELVILATALYLTVTPLFEIQEVQVTPGLLTLSGIFNANEYNPNQIANIAMQTARSRRGTATHFIVVKPVDSKAISLAGFQGGEKTIFSMLQN